MNKLNLIFSVISTMAFMVIAPGTAHTAPALALGCDYSDSSLYGGYGWHPSLSQSCDPVVNEATGTAVQLTRTVWDSNADIANRTIQCDLYYFDAARNSYQREPEIHRQTSHPSYQIRHLPTSPLAPFAGWKTTRPTDASFEEINDEFSQWSVENGTYTGGGVLDYRDLELVTRDDGVKVVRRWVSDRFPGWNRFGRSNSVGFAKPGYFECRDLSGADFSPTGAVGIATTMPAVLSDLEFTVAENPNAGQPGDVVNLETGQTVNLIKARWNYNRDIAGKSISCVSGIYNGSEYQRYGSKYPIHPYHYTDSESRVYYRTNSDREELPAVVGSYELTGNVLQFSDNGLSESSRWIYGYTVDPIFASAYVELIDRGIRMWQSSDYYEECVGTSPSASQPTIQPPRNGSCDYSFASANGGWGWNAITQESCAPTDLPPPGTGAAGCDYSNAIQNGGWGWNAETHQSCPPQTTRGSCEYSNADQNGGWGWNAIKNESCPPL